MGVELQPVMSVDKPLDDLNSFVQAIASIHPKKTKVTDLWMNDEVLIEFASDCGDFDLSIVNWGSVFIMAPKKQSVIMRIDELLSSHNSYVKLQLDMGEYK